MSAQPLSPRPLVTPVTTREERRAMLVDEIREVHDRKGHTWSSRSGYCSEPNGITAVWCDTGVLLEALAATPPDAVLEGLDVEPVSTHDPEFRALSNRIHRMMSEDPLMGPCGGTHVMGYATCQRIALIVRALPTPQTPQEPGDEP